MNKARAEPKTNDKKKILKIAIKNDMLCRGE